MSPSVARIVPNVRLVGLVETVLRVLLMAAVPVAATIFVAQSF
jgi:hypothetical protein